MANYEDERFKAVEQEQQTALNNVNNTYNNMIAQNDKYYNDMTTAAENYGKQQAQIQQANTDFAIEQINQQKDQANKDYIREQKGAYADWQKESNQYGVNAEQLATAGLSRTGYSESSQVSMYNTYQNRLGQARDTYQRAVLDYDNGIKEAQLTNNAKLAEIAYQTLQAKLELGLNKFNSKNQLLQQRLAAQQGVNDTYYGRWQDVLKQINAENSLAEEQRQFNEKMTEERRQFDTQYKLQQQALKSSGGSSGSKKGSGGGSKKGSNNNTYTLNSKTGSSKNSLANTINKIANAVGNQVNFTSKAKPQIKSKAGKEALDYITNFVSGDPKNPRRLTVLDQRTIEKYLANQYKQGMTDAELEIIQQYMNNNFKTVDKLSSWIG